MIIEGKFLLSTLDPFVTNGLSHPYHLDVSTFIYRGIRSNFSFFFHFSMKFKSAYRIAPDGKPHFFLRRPIWGYSVCLFPIKWTPRLYGLIKTH